MKYIKQKQATKNLTILLGKLGLPYCFKNDMTMGGWSGQPRPYIKYGLSNNKIHEFVLRFRFKRGENTPQDNVLDICD